MTGQSYIVDCVRTPRAKKKGRFTEIHPVDLLTYPLKAIISRNNLEAGQIEDVITGCVTQVKEQSWCVARAAVLASGFPIEVPGCTINRLCASSLQALNLLSSQIKAGEADLLIAAGLEHMTRVPMFSDTGGEQSPMLLKAFPDLVSQGLAAERIARQWNFNRRDFDIYACASQEKAVAAKNRKAFSKSVIAVPVPTESSQSLINLTEDDNPRSDTTVEILAGLKPAFLEDGLLTAGNSSAIVDAASAVLLASEKALQIFNLTARAKVVAHVVVGSDPNLMLTGPISASRRLLEKTGLTVKDIDLWEINEAFAPIPLITIKDLKIDAEKVNVNGGAIALGHPLGATGTILVGTLLDELESRNLKRGVVSMCIGLGMGVATLIERL